MGTRAGVDDPAEPRGKAGAYAVVVSSKCRIGLKPAPETDLHLPGEVKIGREDRAVPLGELIRFRAAGCDAGVQRVPKGAVEADHGVGDGLPFLRAAGGRAGRFPCYEARNRSMTGANSSANGACTV